ncbi:hypothetical protein [Chondromyces apiculatus]|uniref:Uncharacterized protein n=1 Tax=Chondromyces apiculatus DSM 436 TaxID=1192034 RepID=A0A017SYD5_9BACT|nr:hypothetical protein [Chondromyces apiculatus]EYF01989.1 Hypothetical protein CAP_7607 [Chondromyces apiculatus DSM 436]
MAKLNGLALSSIVAGALVSLAASTAHAAPITSTVHLDLMFDLAASLYGVDPAEGRNNWATPSEACAITWSGGSAQPAALTKGACFFTLALRQADPTVTTTKMWQWWGANNPSSPTYYDAVAAGAKFHNLPTVAEIVPGDLLVAKYTTQGGVLTGYNMVVSTIDVFTVLPNGNTRYILEVIDSTRDPHGEQDSRWNIGGDIQGVGYGLIFLDANAATGAIDGHSWSNQGKNQSDYYTLAQRPLLAGRFDRNK